MSCDLTQSRFYHTLTHIEELFAFYDEYYTNLDDPLCCSLSIWFHDVIYNPKKNDNEEKSAELFKEFAEECGLNAELTTKVYKYIMATKSHASENLQDSDLSYFLDFDMAILGKDSKGYKIYADQIRQEYIHYPEPDYKKGRPAVLKKLMEIGLYKTKIFQEKYEKQAKENMQQEIQRLEQ